MTAVDTNVIIALWDQDETLNLSAQQALDDAYSSGGLAIAAPVYAELLAFPARTEEMLDDFFSATDIYIDWEMNETIWRSAGNAYQAYSVRRQHGGGSAPRRILADFLIGAHATVHEYTLLTLDQRLYRTAFPNLRIKSF